MLGRRAGTTALVRFSNSLQSLLGIILHQLAHRFQLPSSQALEEARCMEEMQKDAKIVSGNLCTAARLSNLLGKCRTPFCQGVLRPTLMEDYTHR